MTAATKKKVGAALTVPLVAVTLSLGTTLATNAIAWGKHIEHDETQSDQIHCLALDMTEVQEETKADYAAMDARLRLAEQAVAVLPSINERLGNIEQLLMEGQR